MNERSAEIHPGERDGDGHGRLWHAADIFWRHKLYRDIWLILITVAVVLALQSAGDATDSANRTANQAKALARQNNIILHEIQQGRTGSIREACQTDQILANIDRLILNDALRRARSRGQTAEAKSAAKFYNGVLAPLGGLKVLSASKRNAQCEARVQRAGAG